VNNIVSNENDEKDLKNTFIVILETIFVIIVPFIGFFINIIIGWGVISGSNNNLTFLDFMLTSQIKFGLLSTIISCYISIVLWYYAKHNSRPKLIFIIVYITNNRFCKCRQTQYTITC